ncbi:hypothetical protein BP5796_00813 [Coleophoma crateriformis]|uniref:HotDog ACOT-type domain-containing protein n=1 Tax=Coleophoma crateriformis TaxID=565419 RepID=A0A3D8T913_9HELO|nr:hypothetical protein BP5796_00813 [Coleophoma crateriformis]
MAKRLRAFPRYWPSICKASEAGVSRPRRHFSSSMSCGIDGVYSELTAMRTQIPFIEALKAQSAEKDGKLAVKHVPIQDQIDSSPKTMSQSYHKVVLPLAHDPWLLDSYINSSGHIRLGTIFMDLDAMAGVISFKHSGDNLMNVTAAVDRITLKRPLTAICDLELSGKVTFATGRSSMELSLQVAKAPEEGKTVQDEDILMTCAFTMVSLDPVTKKAVNISPLKIENAEEQRLFDQGKKNYAAKKELAKATLRKNTPNDEESDLIHALWLRQLDYHDPNTPTRKPANAMYMEATKIQSVQIMQPQYRNRSNFNIFGGFLLRTTFELAFTCASAMSHTRPTFVALDPSTFENPVTVGSVLYLTAQVVYTDSPVVDSGDPKASAEGSTRIQIRVDSKIRNVEHGETKPTGVFNYTFEVKKDIKVIPESYSQFIMYLDARRRALNTIQSIESPNVGDGSGGSTAGVLS